MPLRFDLGELVVPEEGHVFYPTICKVIERFPMTDCYLIDNGHGERCRVRDDQLASMEAAAAHMMMTDPRFKDRSIVVVTPDQPEGGEI